MLTSVSVRALQQPCKHADVLSQCSNTTLVISQRCPRQSILPAVRACWFTTADTHIRCWVLQNLITLNCGISQWSRHDASLHQTWRRWGLRRAGTVFYWSCRPAVTLGQWLSSAEVQQNTQISLHQHSQYVWQRWYIEHYHPSVVLQRDVRASVKSDRTKEPLLHATCGKMWWDGCVLRCAPAWLGTGKLCANALCYITDIFFKGSGRDLQRYSAAIWDNVFWCPMQMCWFCVDSQDLEPKSTGGEELPKSHGTIL